MAIEGKIFEKQYTNRIRFWKENTLPKLFKNNGKLIYSSAPPIINSTGVVII